MTVKNLKLNYTINTEILKDVSLKLYYCDVTKKHNNVSIIV